MGMMMRTFVAGRRPSFKPSFSQARDDQIGANIQDYDDQKGANIQEREKS